MTADQMYSLTPEIQREIKGKLAVLAAMTPASRADWFMAIPLHIALYFTPRQIVDWASSSSVVEIEWGIHERRGLYAPRY